MTPWPLWLVCFLLRRTTDACYCLTSLFFLLLWQSYFPFYSPFVGFSSSYTTVSVEKSLRCDISSSPDQWFSGRSCGLPASAMAACWLAWHIGTFLHWLGIQLIKPGCENEIGSVIRISLLNIMLLFRNNLLVCWPLQRDRANKPQQCGLTDS